MNANNITTTINSRGNISDTMIIRQIHRAAVLNLITDDNLNYEGGLICATSNTKVSDCVRGSQTRVFRVMILQT